MPAAPLNWCFLAAPHDLVQSFIGTFASLSAAGSRKLAVMLAGFDRAPEDLGSAHCGHTASRGPAPAACLKALQTCTIAGDSPLPFLSRQGRRAQPDGDFRKLLNPGYLHTRVGARLMKTRFKSSAGTIGRHANSPDLGNYLGRMTSHGLPYNL